MYASDFQSPRILMVSPGSPFCKAQLAEPLRKLCPLKRFDWNPREVSKDLSWRTNLLGGIGAKFWALGYRKAGPSLGAEGVR